MRNAWLLALMVCAGCKEVSALFETEVQRKEREAQEKEALRKHTEDVKAGKIEGARYSEPRKLTDEEAEKQRREWIDDEIEYLEKSNTILSKY